MMIHLTILVLLFSYTNADSVVTLKNGQVQGIFEETVNNRRYSSFYCIPYAQNPIGSLRFQPPLAVANWTSILKADKLVKCPHYTGEKYEGQEDCLCVNVFVPTLLLKGKEKVPVVVVIHGGAFLYGNGQDYYGPDYLLDRDVVLVTMNYRLGALGFISTEDDVIPGNMGMKDQTLALKWVKENIENFSGNPQDVTLMGFSAGGASVMYHFLSKSSRGLFKAGVCMSGSPLNSWALQENPLDIAKDLADKLKCNASNSKEIKECLNRKTAFEITTAVFKKQLIWLGLPFSPYAPVVEKNCTNAFICQHPLKLLKNKDAYDIPVIYSMSEDEGLFPSARWLNDNSTLKYLDDNWLKLCPMSFDFHIVLNISQQHDVCNRIKQHYLNNKPVSMETFHNLTNALTDRVFNLDIEKNAKLHAKFNDKVFVYRYNYYSVKQPTYATLQTNASRQGICHGDDIYLIFSQFHGNVEKFEMDPADKHVQDVLWDLILSLKTGSPSSLKMKTVWTPMNDSGNLNYLYFNNTIEMKSTMSLSEPAFWDSIPFQENENVI